MQKYFFILITLLYAGLSEAGMQEALLHWSKRDIESELVKALNEFEAVIQQDPSNHLAATYFVRGSFLLAGSHLSDSDKEKKKEILKKGREIGERALGLVKTDLDEALAKLEKKDVPLIYWTMSNVGYLSELNGIMSSIGNRRQIIEMLKTAEKLDPDYLLGSIPRFWGAYYAVVPGIAGGSLKKSKKYFDQSIQVGPQFLINKVLMAELYWTRKDDRKEFEKVLKDVIESTVTHPEVDAENKLDKMKAERLLKKADELF